MGNKDGELPRWLLLHYLTWVFSPASGVSAGAPRLCLSAYGRVHLKLGHWFDFF